MSEHEDQINALIPEATLNARRRVFKLGIKEETREGTNEIPRKHDFFSEFFHDEMNRFAAKKGLRFR